jgi:hypothetical protein
MELTVNRLAPLPEHDWLKCFAGKWTVECQYFYADDEEPVYVQGSERSRMVGPFWLVSETTLNMLAGPVTAIASTTFDPDTLKYVTIWIDSSTPYHQHFSGRYSRLRHELTERGMNYDPVTRDTGRYTRITRFLAPDASERTLDLEVESPPGERMPILHYHYRKAS